MITFVKNFFLIKYDYSKYTMSTHEFAHAKVATLIFHLRIQVICAYLDIILIS